MYYLCNTEKGDTATAVAKYIGSYGFSIDGKSYIYNSRTGALCTYISGNVSSQSGDKKRTAVREARAFKLIRNDPRKGDHTPD